MKDAFQKLLNWEKAEVLKYFYRAKSTFAVNVPKPQSVLAEAITSAFENMIWYRDNKYPDIASSVMEYGISYCQYSYSLPRPATELFTLYMQINNAAFFEELGFTEKYYNQNQFDIPDIKGRIRQIIGNAKDKYKSLKFDADLLNFSSLVEFNASFLKQIEILNFDSN